MSVSTNPKSTQEKSEADLTEEELESVAGGTFSVGTQLKYGIAPPDPCSPPDPCKIELPAGLGKVGST
jgi:hypothetical protein